MFLYCKKCHQKPNPSCPSPFNVQEDFLELDFVILQNFFGKKLGNVVNTDAKTHVIIEDKRQLPTF
jgi:hypothetical protein